MKDKLIDIFNFRIGTEEEADGSLHPIITAGSVAWGILFRAALLTALAFLLLSIWDNRDKTAWIFVFLIWGLAVYPGWKQYQVYSERIKKVQEETMCGSCKHFDMQSQLCKIYDEHISINYLPCEGESWEAGESITN